jgi:capsular exopolysaccharide synthesis family protein
MSLATWKDFLRIIESNPRIAQTYETLLSSLRFAEKNTPTASPLKSLMVCSAQPGEGKTTVSVGLTLTMALGGQRVLLVDADTRKPKLREIFELPEKRGFTDVLAEDSKVELRDVVQTVALQRGRTLEIVPSGTRLRAHENPMASPRLEAFVAAACREYEIVLFDSPPVLAVSDPCFLAPLMTGVIFVVGSGTVQERDARLAKDRIQKAGGRLLGFVMNRFDDSRDGPGYHPYEGYYDNSKA